MDDRVENYWYKPTGTPDPAGSFFFCQIFCQNFAAWQILLWTIILTNIFIEPPAWQDPNQFCLFCVFSVRMDFSFCGILQLEAFPPTQHYIILAIWLKFSPLALVDFTGQKGNWYLWISIPHNVLILCGMLALLHSQCSAQCTLDIFSNSQGPVAPKP